MEIDPTALVTVIDRTVPATETDQTAPVMATGLIDPIDLTGRIDQTVPIGPTDLTSTDRRDGTSTTVIPITLGIAGIVRTVGQPGVRWPPSSRGAQAGKKFIMTTAIRSTTRETMSITMAR